MVKESFFMTVIDTSVQERQPGRQRKKKERISRRISGNPQKTEKKKKKESEKAKKTYFISYIVQQIHI